MENNVISSYTAKQAIEDGILVEVDEKLASNAGFKWPVRLTSHLHSTLIPPKGSTQDYTGRIWDVLFLARLAIKRNTEDSGLVEYTVKIGPKNHRLWICIDGTDGFPALHIMHPEDY